MYFIAYISLVNVCMCLRCEMFVLFNIKLIILLNGVYQTHKSLIWQCSVAEYTEKSTCIIINSLVPIRKNKLTSSILFLSKYRRVFPLFFIIIIIIIMFIILYLVHEHQSIEHSIVCTSITLFGRKIQFPSIEMNFFFFRFSAAIIQI